MRLEKLIIEKTKHCSGIIRGCEIGVWDGGTSKVLLNAIPNLHLYMIDPWQAKNILGSMKTTKRQRTMNTIMQKAIDNTEEMADRRTIINKRSIDAVNEFKDEELDFIFIDANHLYEYVKEDIQAWFPKVKSNGFLTGHDYNGKSDQAGIWGVKKAVDEFAEKHNFNVEVYPKLLWYMNKENTNAALEI